MWFYTHQSKRTPMSLTGEKTFSVGITIAIFILLAMFPALLLDPPYSTLLVVSIGVMAVIMVCLKVKHGS